MHFLRTEKYFPCAGKLQTYFCIFPSKGSQGKGQGKSQVSHRTHVFFRARLRINNQGQGEKPYVRNRSPFSFLSSAQFSHIAFVFFVSALFSYFPECNIFFPLFFFVLTIFFSSFFLCQTFPPFFRVSHFILLFFIVCGIFLPFFSCFPSFFSLRLDAILAILIREPREYCEHYKRYKESGIGIKSLSENMFPVPLRRFTRYTGFTLGGLRIPIRFSIFGLSELFGVLFL